MDAKLLEGYSLEAQEWVRKMDAVCRSGDPMKIALFILDMQRRHITLQEEHGNLLREHGELMRRHIDLRDNFPDAIDALRDIDPSIILGDDPCDQDCENCPVSDTHPVGIPCPDQTIPNDPEILALAATYVEQWVGDTQLAYILRNLTDQIRNPH